MCPAFLDHGHLEVVLKQLAKAGNRKGGGVSDYDSKAFEDTYVSGINSIFSHPLYNMDDTVILLTRSSCCT